MINLIYILICISYTVLLYIVYEETENLGLVGLLELWFIAVQVLDNIVG